MLLSEVFAGKKGLSPKKAEFIVKGLGLSSAEGSYFCDLVTSLHARSEGPRSQVSNLTFEAFSLIHEWYHFAILEFTHVKGFVPDADWVSMRLNVPKDKILLAVERLRGLDCFLWKTSSPNKTTRDLPSSRNSSTPPIQPWTRRRKKP